MGSDESGDCFSCRIIDPIIIGDDGIETRLAWIWCIQCSDIDDKTTHCKTKVFIVCDSKTGEPNHLGTGGEDEIQKPCACRPKKLEGAFLYSRRPSPKYVYALTYPHPGTGESLNYAVDFDTVDNTLTVLDACNFSLNELEHTLGSLFSIPWKPVNKNHAIKNLANLLP